MVGKGEKRNKKYLAGHSPKEQSKEEVKEEVNVQQLNIIPTVLLPAVPPWIL